MEDTFQAITETPEKAPTIIPSAPWDKKVNFLLAVLEAEERRRDSLENKLSILVAANAILLGTILGIGIPAFNSVQNPWIEIPVTLLATSASVISILLGSNLLKSFGNQESRSRIMDLNTDSRTEFNLFLFLKIAGFQKLDYISEVDSLTEQQIFEQLASQAHNLARLLVSRYQTMNHALISFIIAVIGFVLLFLIKILGV